MDKIIKEIYDNNDIFVNDILGIYEDAIGHELENPDDEKWLEFFESVTRFIIIECLYLNITYKKAVEEYRTEFTEWVEEE